MSRRPLVIVPALTLGDLLLWHWSLAAHHEALALVSGLSLPPLLLASVCVAAFVGVRLVARGMRAPLTLVSRTRAGRTSTSGVLGTARNATAGPAAARSQARLAATRPPLPRPSAGRSTAPRPAQVAEGSADRDRPPRKLAA